MLSDDLAFTLWNLDITHYQERHLPAPQHIDPSEQFDYTASYSLLRDAVERWTERQEKK